MRIVKKNNGEDSPKKYSGSKSVGWADDVLCSSNNFVSPWFSL
jgi:hypothetical protein